MFGILKKKISNFTGKLKKKVEEKTAEQIQEPVVSEKEELEKVPDKPEVQETEKEPGIPETAEAEKEKKELTEEEKIWKEAEAEILAEEKKEKPVKEKEAIPKETPLPEKKEEIIPEEIKKEQPEETKIEEELPEKPEEPEEPKEELPEEPEEKPILKHTEKRELRAKLGFGRKVKRFFRAEITIEEKDLGELLEEMELSLLEADVEQSAAEEIIKEMKTRLAGKKIASRDEIDNAIKKEIREILLEMMETEQINVLEEIKKNKPFKILFLGPNGAGKTTSIAKLTKMLQDKGLSVIWAASDTFRAASIEQLESHAKKLNVRVVKHGYGADPAAVAFDAVKAAEAKKIDVVLIDSAGRQETNKNLMEELKKIGRVIKPNLKVYVGESFTGQALLQQASEYNEKIGIDGFILSKIDCDSKGGTTISLLYKLKKPVLFVGTGQEYKDLQEFKPDFVLDRIF